MAVNPFYRAEDLKNLECPDHSSCELPQRVGAPARGGCRIREAIDEVDLEAANRAAQASVAAGTDEIAFRAVRVANAAELKLLTANLDEVPLHFEYADEPLIRLLIEWLRERHRDPVSTGFDALANVEFAAKVITAAQSRFVPFTIHAEEFEESGATRLKRLDSRLLPAWIFWQPCRSARSGWTMQRRRWSSVSRLAQITFSRLPSCARSD